MDFISSFNKGTPPYSLGKLIDWKLYTWLQGEGVYGDGSLLAREINWLETPRWVHLSISPLPGHSLLAREINWLETFWFVFVSMYLSGSAPYSLGKLIDWKPSKRSNNRKINGNSLLAREINWLETRFRFGVELSFCWRKFSLLAREINWLETSASIFLSRAELLISPYSLGKLIDWKLISFPRFPAIFRSSLLAREINWLETS